ncbi:MAG: hypothetical protein LBT38_10705, partial [Deltaproteobacteria bacterium]|nr:hypothetical protein [Deltaproteobacteria bacterium]
MTETRLETKEISLQYWNQKAPSYKKRLDTSGNDEVHAKIIQAVTQRASLNEKSQVLDLGCGPGRHSRLMAQTGAKVTG